jgi:serine/threonine protein kinase
MVKCIGNNAPSAIRWSKLSWGTPHYIYPEVISGHVSTPLSDVYAFEVLMYEALTGRSIRWNDKRSLRCSSPRSSIGPSVVNRKFP